MNEWFSSLLTFGSLIEWSNTFMEEVELSKYPSEMDVSYEGNNLKKGDIVELIDKNSGINGIYKVVKIKRVNEVEKIKLKFVKRNT